MKYEKALYLYYQAKKENTISKGRDIPFLLKRRLLFVLRIQVSYDISKFTMYKIQNIADALQNVQEIFMRTVHC